MLTSQSSAGAEPGAAPSPTRSLAPASPRRTAPRTAPFRVLSSPDATSLAVLLLLTALVSWQRIWFWDGLAYLDVATFYLPWYAHLGEALRAFDIPGWNPYLFSGTPFAGDPQSGWMYLPAMVFFTLLKPVAAYQWFLVFHLVLAALSTYAYARVVGMRQISAVVAASAYAFGPLVNHITCCLIHVQLAVWIPSALLGVELAARAGSRGQRLAGWSLAGFAVSQMLAGWVGQGAYNGCLLVAAYVVYRSVLSPIRPLAFKARILDCAVSGLATFGIGIGLAAAGLLPRLDAVRGTNVAGGEYSGLGSENYADGWTVPQLIAEFMGNGHSYFTALFYLGGATLTLGFMAIVLTRRRYASPFFLGVTAVTAIMCLEQITPLHRLFYLLPRFEVLHEHVPTRIVAVQWIGPAMLAGAAVETLLSSSSIRRPRAAAWTAMGVWTIAILYLIPHERTIGWAALVIAGLLCHAVAGSATPARWAKPSLRHGLAALMLIAVLWEPTGRMFVRAVAFDAVDPVLVLPVGPIDRDASAVNAATTDPGGAGEFLQDRQAEGEVFRFFGYDQSYFRGGWGWPSTYREFFYDPVAQDLLVNARAMGLDLYDAQGYNPVQLANYVLTFDVVNGDQQNYHDAQVLKGGVTSPLLNMLNVRYIVIPAEVSPGRPRPDLMELAAAYPEVFRNDTIRVLENPNVLPRAWIVHDVVQATQEFGLIMIGQGLVDPATTAFLEPDVDAPSLAQPADPAAESATVTTIEDDEVTLSVSLEADGLVVMSEIYADGWTAYVDGEETPIYQANGVLRAVNVPVGEHTLELRYEPLSLRLGLYLSAATAALIVVALAALWLLGDRRRGRVRGAAA